MSVLGDPLLHLDGEPEGVDAKGNNGEKQSLDVVTEQLDTRAVKGQLVTVDDRVLHVPSFLDAKRPGKANAQGE